MMTLLVAQHGPIEDDNNIPVNLLNDKIKELEDKNYYLNSNFRFLLKEHRESLTENKQNQESLTDLQKKFNALQSNYSKLYTYQTEITYRNLIY